MPIYLCYSHRSLRETSHFLSIYKLKFVSYHLGYGTEKIYSHKYKYKNTNNHNYIYSLPSIYIVDPLVHIVRLCQVEQKLLPAGILNEIHTWKPSISDNVPVPFSSFIFMFLLFFFFPFFPLIFSLPVPYVAPQLQSPLLVYSSIPLPN